MNTTHVTENLTVHVTVLDYAIWRTGYDARETNRRSAGITNSKVFCNALNPNDVVILSDVGDVAKGTHLFASEDQKTAMLKSGVIGTPTIRFA